MKASLTEPISKKTLWQSYKAVFAIVTQDPSNGQSSMSNP